MSRQQLPPHIKKITLADKSIRYQLTVDVGTDPDTGKRRQVRRRFQKKDDAKSALTEISGKVARDEFVPGRAFSVDDLCADWLASLHGLRATTIAGYEYDLAPLRETHGVLPVQRLTRRHIDDLVTGLSAGGSKTAKGHVRRPWAARSLNRTIDTTAMVLEYGVERPPDRIERRREGQAARETTEGNEHLHTRRGGEGAEGCRRRPRRTPLVSGSQWFAPG
jgi:hypothetical protein